MRKAQGMGKTPGWRRAKLKRTKQKTQETTRKKTKKQKQTIQKKRKWKQEEKRLGRALG